MDSPKRYWHIVCAVHRYRDVPLVQEWWTQCPWRPLANEIITQLEPRVRRRFGFEIFQHLGCAFSIIPTIIDAVSEEDYNHAVGKT